MNSLVGYGVSSDSESEEDGDRNNGTISSKGVTLKEKTVVTKTRNFLLESGSASSESDGDSEPEGEDATRPSPRRRSLAVTASSPSTPHRQPQPPPPAIRSLPPPPPNKLPPPPLGTCAGSGVFANPFKAQADQKLNVLQKHVPLTMQAKPALIGGKRVCVAYRKDGRCRFGIKCKYAHDSDLQNPLSVHGDPGLEMADSSPGESHPAGSKGEDDGQPGKKRRVGLSNTLIPPKRAMKQYAQQKERDRPKMS
ncbi:uncharacterized protein si:ch211-113e8.11 [Gadus macrocephalus]|uniref:uncharacterized protein si:ch211-113e8.11 n=1 Tax=Gadus macrocephalus TaxID=80720 RepID=UPI0028CBB04B|nr:uncharacterized protein si:ch211-113e8.11 [Gadus macrocephalus]